MHDLDSNFAGGVKLCGSRELDVHWRRPDEWGYRSLRAKAVPPKGISKEERAAIRAEHERLLTTWREHCPPRLSKHDYWERLNVNTGSVLLCGGVMFEREGDAYFCLGFQINKAEHAEMAAAGEKRKGAGPDRAGGQRAQHAQPGRSARCGPGVRVAAMNHYDDDEPSLSLRARLAMTGWIGTGLAGLLTAANHLPDLFLLIAR